jgi:hypothetical protein
VAGRRREKLWRVPSAVDGGVDLDRDGQSAALEPLPPAEDAGAGLDDGVEALSFGFDDDPFEEEFSDAVADLRLSVR